MNNDAIVSYCATQHPDYIYLAIGCAQGHWAVGHPMASPQGHPPPVKALGGRQICILIDPELENPPRCCEMLTPTNSPMIHEGQVTYITSRRLFSWGGTDAPFINDLCNLALTSRAFLIVQDFSGKIIDEHYPVHQFGPHLLKKVLFDFTYRDGGCFIDLAKVRILRREDGSFVQPAYEPVSTFLHLAPPSLVVAIIKARTTDAWCYLKRFHNIQRGAEEFRDWCTVSVVRTKMRPLCLIYGTPLSTDTPALEETMTAYLSDLCYAAENPMTEEQKYAIIQLPGKEYQNTLELLGTVLSENVAHQ